MWFSGSLNSSSYAKNSVFLHLITECLTLSSDSKLSKSLRTKLERFSFDERKDIVGRTKSDGCAPLFIVSKRGNVEVAEYLISVCGANVEQKGLFEIPDDSRRSVHTVTPLWCAAVAGQLPMVKCLIKHRADINSVSDTGSTPVRSACFMSHYDIVLYLVEHGADISKPNHNAGTCLINSVQSVDLCKLLIKHGADVNAQDIQNKTALHYAVQEHRVDATKLLIENNANAFLKSKCNDDALQTACLRGSCAIFKYLITVIKYNSERIADGYELLGSTFLDENHDIQSALKFWHKAVSIRKSANILKSVLPPCAAFQYITEFRNEDELSSLSLDEDLIRMQSLLICQRILGSTHKDMIFRLMYRGAAYADALNYQKCINLWLYALKLKTKDSHLFSETCFTPMQALVRLYLDMIDKHCNGCLKITLSFDDAILTLEILVSQLINTVKVFQFKPEFKYYLKNYDEILKIFLHMVYVILNISITEEQMNKVISLVKDLVGYNPKTSKGNGLIHLAVMKQNYLCTHALLEERHMTPFPSPNVLSFLLTCGANVNSKGEKGCSPLFLAAKPSDYNHKVICMLLQAGAHIDQVNDLGHIPLSLMQKNTNCDITFMNYITLCCLAARVIRNNNIPFKNKVPNHLRSFVMMH